MYLRASGTVSRPVGVGCGVAVADADAVVVAVVGAA
jgi:hypothetical protein